MYIPPALRNGKAKDMAEILDSRVQGSPKQSAPASPSLLGSEKDCVPMWVEGPGDFFVMPEELNEYLEASNARLEEFVEKASSTVADLPVASVGLWVAAPFEGSYYRGIVKELLAANRALVFFLDFGNHEEVRWVDMIPLSDELQRPKAFAIHVALNDWSKFKEENPCG